MPIELSQQNQATVANSYLLSLIEFCEHIVGPEIYPNLKFLDIDNLKLSAPDRRIDAREYNKTLTTVSKNFDLPTLGLDFGAQIGAAAFNLLGYLTMASDTLGSAAVGLQKYNRLVSNMGQSQISFEDDIGFAEWLVFGEASHFSYHVVDAVLAGWCSFSRRIVEKEIPVIKVELKHQDLGQRQHYQKIFGGDVIFNASRNRIIFERKWFDLPVAQAQQ
ncbi:MAG: AraC family transcriptional regulator, partial [Kangiellaceae bacterium]|nr:AraC family transcriptional regulator [Kangiellaceae bacterium]